MRKEARLNLIFFGILLVLLAPGFIILMRKKLSGSSEPNYMPDPIPHAVGYVQPAPVPPGLPRVEPPEARQWTTKLVHERVSPTASVLTVRDNVAIVSDAFRTQALCFVGGEPESRLLLMLWDDRVVASGSNPRIEVRFNGVQQQIEASNVDSVPVPKDVRHALQRVGYVDPPEKVWIIAFKFASFPAQAMPDRIILGVTEPRGTVTTETITLK